MCLKSFEQIYLPFPSPIPTLFSHNFSLSASSVPLLKVHGAHLLLPFCAKGLVPSARARETRETSLDQGLLREYKAGDINSPDF